MGWVSESRRATIRCSHATLTQAAGAFGGHSPSGQPREQTPGLLHGFPPNLPRGWLRWTSTRVAEPGRNLGSIVRRNTDRVLRHLADHDGVARRRRLANRWGTLKNSPIVPRSLVQGIFIPSQAVCRTPTSEGFGRNA